jgi:hypothetical protein
VSFHGLGALAGECLVALAANEGEVLMAPSLLKDELGQFLFGDGELLAGGDALGFKEALLDQLRAAGLDGEVSLGKGDLLLPGIAILGDELAGVAGEHDVIVNHTEPNQTHSKSIDMEKGGVRSNLLCGSGGFLVISTRRKVKFGSMPCDCRFAAQSSTFLFFIFWALSGGRFRV